MLQTLVKFPVYPHTDHMSIDKAMLYGALVWAVYSILQVVVNGIVIDESVIAAQIITGSVNYPVGHPHGIYYHNIYSLAHYLAAILWWLEPSPLIISAIQNVIYLFLSTMAAFSMALVLTRRALWGYIAGTLVSLEAYRRFSGVYPLVVFPHIYSNGHIGLQLSVLVIALLFNKMWRTGGLLLGLFPAIHAIHALVIWAWSILYLGFHRNYPGLVNFRRLAVWTATGLTVCVGLAVIITFTAPDNLTAAPYDIEADGTLIREQFLLLTDQHRRPLPFFSFAYMVNPIAFFCLGAVAWYRIKNKNAGTDNSEASSQLLWLMFLGALVWLYIYITSILPKLGIPLPDIVVMSMPGRLSSLTAVLLVPITVAGLHAVLSAMRGTLGLLGLVSLGILLVVAGLLATELFPFTEGLRLIVANNVLFLAWGILFGLEFFVGFRNPGHRWVTISAFVATSGALALFLSNTYVVVYLVAICLFTWTSLKVSEFLVDSANKSNAFMANIAGVLLVFGLVVSAAAALPGRNKDFLENKYLRWDMISDFDRELGEWLRTNADRDELILPFIGPLPRSELQAKISQPVLFEFKTLYIMPYMPKLSASIGMMARDLYGVDYSTPETLKALCSNGIVGGWCPVWKQTWSDRSREEWISLGERYSFRLVLSLSSIPLDLPVKLSGPRWTLYIIE